MQATSDSSRRPLVPRRRAGAGPGPRDAADSHPPVLLVLPELAELLPAQKKAAVEAAPSEVAVRETAPPPAPQPAPLVAIAPHSAPAAAAEKAPPPEKTVAAVETVEKLEKVETPLPIPAPSELVSATPDAKAETPAASLPPAREPSERGAGTGTQRRRRTAGEANTSGATWFSVFSVLIMGGVILAAAGIWLTGWRPWRKTSPAPVITQGPQSDAQANGDAPAAPQPAPAPPKEAKPAPAPSPQPDPKPKAKPAPKPEPKPQPAPSLADQQQIAPPPPAPEKPNLPAPTVNPVRPNPAPSANVVSSYPRTPAPESIPPGQQPGGLSYPVTNAGAVAPVAPQAAQPFVDPAVREYPPLEALRQRPELRSALRPNPSLPAAPSGAALQPAYDPGMPRTPHDRTRPGVY